MDSVRHLYREHTDGGTMAKPYIMPLGFIYTKNDQGTVFLLTNPEDSNNLTTGTPVTVWRYSPEHLALAKIRGLITAIGYTTATFATVETAADPRWPEGHSILQPRTPVFLAEQGSFEPDLSRMLTEKQAKRIAAYARLYAGITKPGTGEPAKPKEQDRTPDSNHNGTSTLDNTSYSD